MYFLQNVIKKFPTGVHWVYIWVGKSNSGEHSGLIFQRYKSDFTFLNFLCTSAYTILSYIVVPLYLHNSYEIKSKELFSKQEASNPEKWVVIFLVTELFRIFYSLLGTCFLHCHLIFEIVSYLLKDLLL